MKNLIYTLSIVCLAFLVSCSSEEPKPAAQQDQGTQTVEVTANETSATTQSIHFYGINTMKFVVTEKSNAIQTSETTEMDGKTYYVVEGFNTKAGEQLKVKLTTISNMSAAAMAHNWLLLKPKANPSAFATASMMARENDYVAPEKMNLVIKEMGLVAPGKSVTITFTAPEQPGEYEYICTFPGHFQAGMRGTLHVK